MSRVKRFFTSPWMLLLSITGSLVVFAFLSKDYVMDNVKRRTFDLDLPRNCSHIVMASPVIRMFRKMFGFDFLPPYLVGMVITTANVISKQNKGKPLLVAFVNNAFVPFTLNWLCNTKHMNIHDDVLLIATDDVARTTLLQYWPDIRVISLNLEAHKNAQTYGEAGYTKILIVRSTILAALISSGIEIVHFETDALWLQDPLPNLLSFKNYDVIAQKCYQRETHFPLGFLFLNNTVATINVINEMAARMAKIETKLRELDQRKAVSEAEMDQPILSDLIMRYPGIRTTRMDYFFYPDGMWYNVTEIRKKSPRPLMIQNNWIKSIDSKISRIKQWKHWFLRDDLTCDQNLVKDVVYDFH